LGERFFIYAVMCIESDVKRRSVSITDPVVAPTV